MAITDYELEAEFFANNPKAKQLVEDLLTNAADAYKHMNKMFGKKKYAMYLNAATYNLNELSKMAGSLENTEDFIDVIRKVYPNWLDAYVIIDELISNSKQQRIKL